MEETNTTVSDIAIGKKEKTKEPGKIYFVAQRIISLIAVLTLFIPSMNPARVSGLISKNLSLFTSAISYNSLITGGTSRLIKKGHIDESAFVIVFIAAILLTLGIIAVGVAACISLGNNKCKRASILTTLIGGAVGVAGSLLSIVGYNVMKNSPRPEKADAIFPTACIVYAVVMAIFVVLAILELMAVPKPDKDQKFEMEAKYKLFVYFIPFAILTFVFCYLPLWGWRYAFFDYRAGDTLNSDSFVGFKWFTYLFQNAATRAHILKVMRNTLVMSGLGILTSWVPLAFAILLTEIENKKFRRFVQTFTTIPNFISWIIVYAIAFAIFSTDGFINSIGSQFGLIENGKNYLMNPDGTWFKMLAWGLWKGTGWSAIIYIAGISGIDRQLYEAATVDGANRYQRIMHVTLPGLLPTYMVMLLLGVAGMLSNGLDQYLIFANANNTDTIEVLDLYVYNLGIKGGSIPLSTVIGMAKSLISVVLLFMANGISKLFRGESIV